MNRRKIYKKRINMLVFLTLFLFIVLIIRISYLQLYKTEASILELNKLATKKVYGPSNIRGRIYDRNNNVIVDNKIINVIMYKKQNNDEIKIAYELAKNIDVDYKKLTTNMLKQFWIVNNESVINNRITKKEYDLYKRRKLKVRDLEKLKLERVTQKDLNTYKDVDKEAAYIYYLMNKGYYYDDKLIKEDITDEEYNYILKSNLKGVYVDKSWQRVYPYGDTLREILGTVSTSEQGVPEEKKFVYLNKGYSLNDRVGLSYLEYEYEDYLKGVKDEYEVKKGVKRLIKKGSRGNDLILSIDINLQMQLEKIIEEELIKAKNEPNTKYYDHTSVVITDPKTGGILAMASKQIINTASGYKVRDYTTNILTGSDTPGSIVKGASMLVGYKTGNLKIGNVFYDKCIKFKNTPAKCSWSSSLGALDDITALKYSSNSYQFQLALKVAGINYYHNMPIKIDNKALDTYRSIFKELGLGVKSEIDLPNETEGYKGKKYDAGLLLNFAIGQYDTYSALQLSSYINTLANNGERIKLNLVKEIRDTNGLVKSKYSRTLLNKVNIDEIYFNRIRNGFISVMNGSLGYGYMGKALNPAGKTGTSESFYDSDLDGKVDTETYTKSFIGYAPANNPVMSIVSISPHVSYKNKTSSYTSSVNKRIVSRICNIFFENYK